jgi:hypothetical protein
MTVGVPARAPLRRHWASPRWWWCWCCAWRVSPRCRCRCVVWMRPARPLGWPRAVTNGQRSRPPAASRPAVRWFTCSETATFWSPRSSHIQSYCPRWILGPKRCRRPSRSGDRGSATVVAAAMVAVLLCITGAGAYLGSVVVARHRAQAAADLAALAAAARLPSGVTAACARDCSGPCDESRRRPMRCRRPRRRRDRSGGCRLCRGGAGGRTGGAGRHGVIRQARPPRLRRTTNRRRRRVARAPTPALPPLPPISSRRLGISTVPHRRVRRQ